MRSETEEFWAGTFGDEYTERNEVDVADRLAFFRGILAATLPGEVNSVCELGAGAGHNLVALRRLDPRLQLLGVDVNEQACREMERQELTVVRLPVSEATIGLGRHFDLVFTSGLLIHVSPEELEDTYAGIAYLASQYVLFNEYLNPTPIEILYRGHEGKLWKRDFAGEFLDENPGFEVVSNGFLWKRLYPAWDNSTYTLMRRRR